MDFFQVIDPVTLQPQGFMRSAIELVLVVVVGCLLCRYVQVGAARLSKNVAGGSKIKPAPTSKGGFGAPPTGDLEDEGLSLKPKDIRSPVVDKSKEVTNAFIVPKPSTAPASNVHHRKPQVDDVPMSPLGSTTNPPSVSSTAAPTRATSIDSFNVKNTSITTPATLTEVKKPLPETSEASHNHTHVPLNKAHGSAASQPATAQAPAADSLLDNVLDELFDDEDILDDALLAATEGSAKDREVSAETKKGDDKKGCNTQPPTQRPQQTKTAGSNPPVSATAPPAVNSSNKTTTVQPAKVDDEEDGMFAEMKRKKLAKQKAQQEQAAAATAAVPSATNTASKMTATPLPSTTKNSQQTEERKAKATMDSETKTAPTASSTNNNANPPSADHLLDNTLDEVFDDEALLDEALTHATLS